MVVLTSIDARRSQVNSLLDQYRNQWEWRDWRSLFNLLPDLSGSTIYDLGCAHGDHSSELAEMGARVIGIDGNESLLNFAKQRDIPNSKFMLRDLSKIGESEEKGDGIWTSFLPAYFTNLDSTIKQWKKLLKEDGWIAITEMSGLFDHEPLSERNRCLIDKFYVQSFRNGNYDFESGSKLKSCLEKNGFKILKSAFLEDQELSFKGGATEDVVNAWESRFERMGGFRQFLGDEFESFKKNFILSIQSENHVSNCKVYFYLATL